MGISIPGVGDLTPVGVAAVVAGFDSFMNQMGSITDSINKLGDLSAPTMSIGELSAGLGALGLAAVGVGAAVVGAAYGLYEFNQSITEVAARTQELTAVNDMLGQRAGYTNQQIDAMTASIRKQGIEIGVAQDEITQFIRYNLDLAKTTDLAKVAQDAAVLGQTNSSDALQRMIWGITTQRTEILRTIGIQVNMNQAYQVYADTIHKGVNELSQNEKQQAALNAVLEAGKSIAGSYTVAQATAGKEARSFPRLVDDIKEALGEPFLGAFGAGVTSVTKFDKALAEALEPATVVPAVFNDMVSATSGVTAGMSYATRSGGELHTVLANIGAIDQIVTQSLGDLANSLLDAVLKGIGPASDAFGQFAENALTWGSNVVANFAQGMVDGAVWALESAMDFIGGMLTYWLAPGSPPKVAPKITEWGKGAMEAWLQGFTIADYSTLDSMESELEKVFKTLENLGRPVDIGNITASFEGLAQVLAEIQAGGSIDYAIIDKIRASTAEFGNEIAAAVEAQLNLAAATRVVEAANLRVEAAKQKVADAQDAINAAEQREVDSSKQVHDLTQQYNQLLRSGASKDALKAKLGEVNAAQSGLEAAQASHEEAQKSLVTAQKQEVQAEKAKAAADKEAVALKAKADLQTQLLGQLEKIADAEAADAKKKAAAAAKETPTQFELPALKGPLIKPEVDTTILDAMKLKLGTIFEPFTKASENIGKKMDELGAHFTVFSDIVTQSWDKLSGILDPILKPILDTLGALVPPDLASKLAELAGNIAGVVGLIALLGTTYRVAAAIIGFALSPLVGLLGLLGDIIMGPVISAFAALSTVLGAIAAVIGWPILILIGVIALFTAAWIGNWFGIRDTLTKVWNDTIKPIFDKVWNWLSVNIPAAWDSFMGAVKPVWDWINTYLVPVFTSFNNVLMAVQNLVGEVVVAAFNRLLDGVLRPFWAFLTGQFNAAITDIQKAWQWLLDKALTPLWNAIQKDLLPAFTNIAKALNINLSSAIDGANTLWDEMSSALKKVQGWLLSVTNWFQGLADKINGVKLPSWLTGHSPPPMADWLEFIAASTDKAAKSISGMAGSMNQLQLPKLQANLQLLPEMVGDVAGLSKPVVTKTSVSAMPTQRQVSVQFGDIHINNGMDVATFKAQVRQTVRELF